MRRAITLIEILIVCAIIVVLAAITTGVLGSVKARAKATVCISNERQLSSALNLYLPDFDEKLPITSTGPRMPNPEWWPTQIEPYLKTKATSLACPIYPKRTYMQAYVGAMATGYALNGCLLSTVVPSPATTIFLAEAADNRYHTATEFGPQVYAWSPDSYWVWSCEHFGGLEPCEIAEPLGSRRHFQRANYTFVDGHIRALEPDAIRVRKGLGKGVGSTRGVDPCPTDPSTLTGSSGEPSFALVE